MENSEDVPGGVEEGALEETLSEDDLEAPPIESTFEEVGDSTEENVEVTLVLVLESIAILIVGLELIAILTMGLELIAILIVDLESIAILILALKTNAKRIGEKRASCSLANAISKADVNGVRHHKVAVRKKDGILDALRADMGNLCAVAIVNRSPATHSKNSDIEKEPDSHSKAPGLDGRISNSKKPKPNHRGICLKHDAMLILIHIFLTLDAKDSPARGSDLLSKPILNKHHNPIAIGVGIINLNFGFGDAKRALAHRSILLNLIDNRKNIIRWTGLVKGTNKVVIHNTHTPP